MCLEILKQRIESMDKNHQVEILRILNNVELLSIGNLGKVEDIPEVLPLFNVS